MQEDLISRAEAVKAALAIYHHALAKRHKFFEADDPLGYLAWLSATAAAKEIVQQLMELPEAGGEAHERA